MRSRPGKAELDNTERGDLAFAARHLIVDMWGAERLDEIEHIERSVREAVDACRANLLHIHFHRFTAGGGVTGVAILAESHITIHTWPELSFAALDVFVCGDTEPEQAIKALERALRPERIEVAEQLRGRIE